MSQRIEASISRADYFWRYIKASCPNLVKLIKTVRYSLILQLHTLEWNDALARGLVENMNMRR